MAPYVALYRKYRPATFAELVGQEPIARTLASAIAQRRLGHAYLFCGPRGTGKTSVARILAKSVNCAQGPTAEPCGACSSCREIANGTNLDVIEIDAASNNGVDNIRDLQDRVALAPVGGRYKVYIIDEVHMLSQGAFNALLKTLEEPPPNVLFVLATTDPHKVLPTIVSRCQRFDFGRIALAPLVGRLTEVAAAEGIPAEPGALEAIARRANGGLRDALSLLDQLAAALAGAPLTAEAVAHSLGLVAGDQIVALGDALVRGDAAEALAIAGALVAAGHEHGTIARELLAHFRHLMVLQLAPERAAALDVPVAHLEALRAQAARLPAGETPWVLEALNETEGRIRRSPQQAIWLELGLIQVARRPAIPSLVELAERVAILEAAIAGEARPIARAPASTPPAAHPPPAGASPAPAPAPVAASPAPEAPSAPTSPHAPLPPPPPQAPAQPPPPANADLPPRPPLEVLEGGPPAPAPASDAPAPTPSPAVPGGQRPVPPGAWERLHEHVRAKSLPTSTLLSQMGALERWESDGAVVIRMPKAFKEQFERQTAKKKLLTDAVTAVFGAGAYPRIEAGEARPTAKPRAQGPAGPTDGASPPRPAPVAPAPVAPPPVARQAAPPVPHDDEPPPPEAPSSDWLDEMEASRPHDEPPGDAATPPRPPAAAGGLVGPAEDPALKLTIELFNGRLVAPGDA